MTKNILGFNDFRNIYEAKKDKTEFDVIVEDIENIIDLMFDEAGNMQFKVKGEKDYLGMQKFLAKKEIPTSVKFDVTEKDYKLDYPDEIDNDFTAGVLAKRKENVSIKFLKKWKDEEKQEFCMEFAIKYTKVTKEMIAKALKSHGKEKDNDEDEEDKEGLKGAF